MKSVSVIKRCAAILFAAAVLMLLSPAASAAGTDTAAPGTQASETAPEAPSLTIAPAGTVIVPDPVGSPVSYGLRVLAARTEMVVSGLCGNEVGLTREDVCRALNLSSVPAITVTELPKPDAGTLFVGSAGAVVGQTVPASALSLISFAAADDTQPCSASFRFTVSGSGYEMTCRICLLQSVNFTPTVALAPALSLRLETYTGVPVSGCLSGYDPEGDEMTFEIVSYPNHGRVVMDDSRTGAYTYTPDSGWVGGDSFTYVVRDEWGNWSAAAQVSVTVSSLPAAVSFADLDGKSCRAAALSVCAAGLMNGTRVGDRDYFRPDTPMTRCELLVTAMNAAGVVPGMTESDIHTALSVFADAETIPAAMRAYVACAVSRGNVAGQTTADGRRVFDPNGTVTRAEASVILSNIIGYAQTDTVTAFADADSLPAWSVPAFRSLKALGILDTPDGTAAPDAVFTRADAAVWLSRTMRLVGA